MKLSAEEVATCIRVLELALEQRGLLGELDDDTRRRLLEAAGRLTRPARHELKQLAKTLRRKRRNQRRAHDAQLVDATEMRTAQRQPVFAAPAERAVAEDRSEDETAEGRTAEDRTAPPQAAPQEELKYSRNCYVCKSEFRRLHFFYDQMCPPCAELNYAKRTQSAALEGRIAVVTGARLKIGYHVALKLLRAGARVVVTTRFPHDAAERFAREADFEAWRTRLQVYGLDLRHTPSVELFAAHLAATLPHVDYLINNAAQTVRRPPPFYAHLLPRERAESATLGAGAAALLAGHERLTGELRAAAALPAGGAARADALVAGAGGAAPGGGGGGVVAWHGGGGSGVGLWNSAELTQLPCAEADEPAVPPGVAAFPAGEVDQDLQQIDLRQHNTWRLTLAEVPVPELLEVHLVNAVAPFVLAARLRPLLERSPLPRRHVVNVSAMEAQFSRRKKTDKHPHTNMAKASLNMMTRTSAPDYLEAGIYMNSVDTGWVTDEDPLLHVARKQHIHDFHPPLDIVDGAARVLDPIFDGERTGTPPSGVFFKDYRSVPW